jgi:L,D-peptidoglycan transpeptidase YkuD (ErfK/YbiS/YcfS/YnhG family)
MFLPVFTIYLMASLSNIFLHTEITEQCRQMIVVEATDLQTDKGVMTLYEKENEKDNWVKVDREIPVMLGKSGLAPADGVLEFKGKTEIPRKQEGDNKSPMGIFGLKFTFGYAEPQETRFIQMPYIFATDKLKCIDDVHSQWYNQVVHTDLIEEPDWKSHEELKRNDDLYKWGIVLDYNMDPVNPGNGSCIFMHLWRNDHTPTAGCTAMSEKDMITLLTWLHPDKNPLIMQGAAEYIRELKNRIAGFGE